MRFALILHRAEPEFAFRGLISFHPERCCIVGLIPAHSQEISAGGELELQRLAGVCGGEEGAGNIREGVERGVRLQRVAQAGEGPQRHVE